jgi:hypothetical protein
MPVDRNSKCPSRLGAGGHPRTSFYLNDVFDALALTPPASLGVALPLALAPAPALRIDKSTSLQYLSLSSKRCANLACSGSVDGGRSPRAMTWLSVQRVST